MSGSHRKGSPVLAGAMAVILGSVAWNWRTRTALTCESGTGRVANGTRFSTLGKSITSLGGLLSM